MSEEYIGSILIIDDNAKRRETVVSNLAHLGKYTLSEMSSGSPTYPYIEGTGLITILAGPDKRCIDRMFQISRRHPDTMQVLMPLTNVGWAIGRVEKILKAHEKEHR